MNQANATHKKLSESVSWKKRVEWNIKCKLKTRNEICFSYLKLSKMGINDIPHYISICVCLPISIMGIKIRVNETCMLAYENVPQTIFCIIFLYHQFHQFCIINFCSSVSSLTIMDVPQWVNKNKFYGNFEWRK